MGNRTPIIAGNWKMYKTIPEAIESAGRLAELMQPEPTDVEVMIAPAFPALYLVQQTLAGSCIRMGAQNMYWEAEGAFTGEVSPDMLLSAGCSHVILGHSERRQFFGETDQGINRKIVAALKNNLTPVFCVGETDAEREEEKTFSVLDKQMEMGLIGFSAEELEPLVLAYEPVWAIGTGKTATSEQAQEVHGYLRQWIEKKFGSTLAKSIRILYGGSVKPENIGGLMAMPDIDGALVGGASLNPDSFSRIVRFKQS
jgi:triosephosphate isomerase